MQKGKKIMQYLSSWHSVADKVFKCHCKSVLVFRNLTFNNPNLFYSADTTSEKYFTKKYFQLFACESLYKQFLNCF